MYSYLDNLQSIDPNTDDNCHRLVDYLAGGLNYAIDLKIPGYVAVRATRSYDAVDIDTSSFPMLKVFRQQEAVSTANLYSGDLIISYSMLMPDRSKLPGIMHWVSRHLVQMLTNWSLYDQACPFRILPEYNGKLKIEYRIMVDNLQNPAYAYLKITVPFAEKN